MSGVTSSVEDGIGLARRLPSLRDRSGMDLAFGGWVAPGGGSFAITALTGARTGSLNGLVIRHGAGLGGKALVLRRPVLVGDYRRAGGITHVYDHAVQKEGLRTVVALPVIVDAVPRTVVYLASRHGMELGDRWLDDLMPMVRRLERDIAVEDEVRRRVDKARSTTELSLTPSELQDLAGELAELTDRIEDASLRDRLTTVSARLSTGANLHRGITVDLTPREVDVLVQVANGCTNQQVADNLGLKPNTAKSYLKSAMRKLAVTNRVQAITAARSAGVLR